MYLYPVSWGNNFKTNSKIIKYKDINCIYESMKNILDKKNVPLVR